MKRPLQGPFAVPLLLVLCGAASFPSTFRRAVGPARPIFALQPPLDPARLNATLLRLDASEPSLRRDINDLLNGLLPYPRAYVVTGSTRSTATTTNSMSTTATTTTLSTTTTTTTPSSTRSRARSNLCVVFIQL